MVIRLQLPNMQPATLKRAVPVRVIVNTVWSWTSGVTKSKTDASQTPWYRKSAVNTDKYKLYLFTGSSVKETVQIGERVVFQAQWK